MKKLYVSFVCFLGILFCNSANAVPLDYSGFFNTDDATVVASIGDMGTKTGFFWQIGHGIAEPYDDTGMAWVTGFEISVYIADNVLASNIGWEFLINDEVIGGWTLSGADGTGYFDFAYTFSEIFSISDVYTIELFVSQAVSPGCGSISLGKNMTFTMSGDDGLGANPVPEPATMMLFGLGLLGLAGVSRKKSLK